MKSWLITIGLLAICGLGVFKAVTDNARPVSASPATQPARQSVQVALTTPELIAMEPTATLTPATPTIAPTATPDVLAQAQQTQAQLAVELAQAQNTAEVAKITAAAIWTGVALTEVRSTQEAAATVAVQATQSQRRSIIAIQTADTERTATAQAPVTQRLQTQADWEPAWQVLKVAGFVFTVVLIAYFTVIISSLKIRQIQEQRQHFRSLIADETPEPQPGKPAESQPRDRVWKSGNAGATLIDITPPGEPDTFTTFAQMVRTDPGLTLAKDRWEGKDSPYTRATYAPVYAWLAKRNFLGWIGAELHLTQEGEEFFDDWLEKHYTPSSGATIAQNSTPTRQASENQPSETEGEWPKERE